MAKVLVLDDDADALQWMTAALVTSGHDVRGFTSGRAALGAIDQWRPDLIVSDLLMPEMDGIAFMRLVHAAGGPAVVLISIAVKHAEAILAGAAGYVTKPATAQEVCAAVEHVLGRRTTRARILIVDDEPDARELYRGFLDHRFEIDEAEDGVAALAALREREYDLVITDVRMPNMNGIELIREIRRDPALERIPIIVQTSDRTALHSSVWRELRVAHRIDKLHFSSWLTRQVDAQLG